MICITKALYRGHLDRIGREKILFYIFLSKIFYGYSMDTLLVAGLCGYKFAEHNLTNG